MEVNQLITEKQARAQNLPGCDVFLNSHLSYRGGINQASGAAQLYREAYLSFVDTIMISNYSQLRSEGRAAQEAFDTGNSSSYRVGYSTYRCMQYMNLENFKIATAFELCLKAILLQKGIFIHYLNEKNPIFKDLAKQQHTRPIFAREYFQIDQYKFNGRFNFLEGLQRQKFKFFLDN